MLGQPAAHRAHPVSGQPPAAHLLAEIIGHLQGPADRPAPCAARRTPTAYGPVTRSATRLAIRAAASRVRGAAEVMGPDAIQDRADHELLPGRILIR